MDQGTVAWVRRSFKSGTRIVRIPEKLSGVQRKNQGSCWVRGFQEGQPAGGQETGPKISSIVYELVRKLGAGQPLGLCVKYTRSIARSYAVCRAVAGRRVKRAKGCARRYRGVLVAIAFGWPAKLLSPGLAIEFGTRSHRARARGPW